MNRTTAINWCDKQLGKALDYDGAYGAQCVDFFNFYVEKVTGKSPYTLGFAVSSAYQLFDVNSPLFTRKVSGIPKAGDIMIYQKNIPGAGGNGHVAIVKSATADTITVYEQNWGRMYVTKSSRKREWERGYMIIKSLEEDMYKGKTALYWYRQYETWRKRGEDRLADIKINRRQIAELKAQLGSADEANILGRALIKLLASLGYKKG